MAKADLLFESKVICPNGFIIEMQIWQLPKMDSERPHGLKYRLFYGRDGHRLIGYDNERGKGDHRHIGDRQEPYKFLSPEQLIKDFMDDIKKKSKENDEGSSAL